MHVLGAVRLGAQQRVEVTPRHDHLLLEREELQRVAREQLLRQLAHVDLLGAARARAHEVHLDRRAREARRLGAARREELARERAAVVHGEHPPLHRVEPDAPRIHLLVRARGEDESALAAEQQVHLRLAAEHHVVRRREEDAVGQRELLRRRRAHHLLELRHADRLLLLPPQPLLRLRLRRKAGRRTAFFRARSSRGGHTHQFTHPLRLAASETGREFFTPIYHRGFLWKERSATVEVLSSSLLAHQHAPHAHEHSRAPPQKCSSSCCPMGAHWFWAAHCARRPSYPRRSSSARASRPRSSASPATRES